MKTSITILALAVLLGAAPSRSFALWGFMTVSKEDAKALGMEVRTTEEGANQVRVDLELNTKGDLKTFTDDPYGRHGRVVLRIGQEDKPSVTAALLEDRSKPGRVAVSFTADRAELDKLTLEVQVPIGLGGQIYKLRVKDFVAPGKGP
jgi:hypothetical protein